MVAIKVYHGMASVKWCVQFGTKSYVVVGRKKLHLSQRQKEIWAPWLSPGYIILIFKVCTAWTGSGEKDGAAPSGEF